MADDDPSLFRVRFSEIDLVNAATLRADLIFEAARRRPPDLTVDLRNVQFIDAAGCNALLAAHRRAQDFGGGITLVGLQRQTRRVLTLVGLLGTVWTSD